LRKVSDWVRTGLHATHNRLQGLQMPAS